MLADLQPFTALVVDDDADREAAARLRLVADALARLSDRDQELVKLVVWDGLATRAAGAVIGVSHVACRVRLHRARRCLAAALELYEESHHQRFRPLTR